MNRFPNNLFAGRRYAVVGLGRAGIAALRALTAMGAIVTGWDDAGYARDQAEREGFLIADPTPDVGDLDALILSPGIPDKLPVPHRVAAAARVAGRPIWTDAELLYQAVRGAGSRARFAGITGTNGKSTTTSLLAHILQTARVPHAAGANLGPAALSLPLLADSGVYVLEMSSYMLERLATLRFDAAVMLNLSPDHLDRHGDMAGYEAAKRQIFARQTEKDAAIIGIDDGPSAAMQAAIPGSISISGARAAEVWCDGSVLQDRNGVIVDLAEAYALPGVHNAQNAAAAAAAAMALCVPRGAIADGIKSFPGLAHRQELVGVVDGVRFVNDSKATNADAAARALTCYRRVVWIAGGIAKDGGIAPLAALFPRVVHAFLIGRDATSFAAELARHHVPCSIVETLDRAVPQALRAAHETNADGVLLSPAGASFDQFSGFEARGTRFRDLVRMLAGEQAGGGVMAVLSRADNSTLARWWRTVDRWTLFAIIALIFFGYVLVLAASPAVAERIHQSRDVFILKQVIFLAASGLVVVGVSLLSPRGVRRMALAGCLIALGLTFLTLFHGVEIKGARRWIHLPGMQVQPSEFLKPCFAVVSAWLLTDAQRGTKFPGMLVAFGIFAVIAVLLKSQPDIGMLSVITAVFFLQLFVRGLNMALVGVSGAGIVGAAASAYVFFPHVRSRVTRFIHPEQGDHYQVDMALQAFGNGGLLGRGPGEGRVKDLLPDAHADFVYAVAGEEFGLIVCLLILCIFAFIVLRGLLRLVGEHDEFIILAAAGLITGFGLQAFVNMASSLHLIPTKGMTLPFISYGGSSALSVALGMGMLLALTRRRTHGDPA